MKFQSKIDSKLLTENSFCFWDVQTDSGVLGVEFRKLQNRAKRFLVKAGYSPKIAEYIDVWQGGDEYCRCHGCATLLNELEIRSDAEYTTMTFTVDPEAMQELIDKGEL